MTSGGCQGRLPLHIEKIVLETIRNGGINPKKFVTTKPPKTLIENITNIHGNFLQIIIFGW